MSYLSLAIGIVIGIVVVIVAVLALNAFFLPNESGVAVDKGRIVTGMVRNLKNAEEKAFQLVLADKTWAPDGDVRKGLGVATAWKRPDAWFAVAVRDFGQTKPREAELIRIGVERLEQYFDGGLELADKPEPTTLSQADGQRLLFRGQRAGVTWWGQMIVAASQGLGYWLYVAAPTREEAERLFAGDLKTGFRIRTDRQGWREQPPKMVSYTTGDGAATLTVPEGLFVAHPARDQDEHGELYLFAKYQKERDNRKNAHILVLALDKQADVDEAATAAKKYLEEKKQEESKDYRIELLNEDAEPSDVPLGHQRGRIAECKLLRDETPMRYWTIAVVSTPERVYVIRCDCAWENRQIWREEFREILRSARVR